jgi:hypothetical protein
MITGFCVINMGMGMDIIKNRNRIIQIQQAIEYL